MKPLRKQIADQRERRLILDADQVGILRTLNKYNVYSRIATPLWMPLVPFLRVVLTDALTQMEELTDD